jgi:hypothetical protein
MRGPIEENPNCQKTHVTFRLMGPTLDLSQVTSVLGLEPSKAFAEGEKVENLTHPSRPVIWMLSTQALVSSTSLEKHLRFLLDKLEPRSARLLELVREQSLEMDFFCYWLSATGHGGPELSAETLSRIGALEARLGLDIYFGDYSLESQEFSPD